MRHRRNLTALGWWASSTTVILLALFAIQKALRRATANYRPEGGCVNWLWSGVGRIPESYTASQKNGLHNWTRTHDLCLVNGIGRVRKKTAPCYWMRFFCLLTHECKQVGQSYGAVANKQKPANKLVHLHLPSLHPHDRFKLLRPIVSTSTTSRNTSLNTSNREFYFNCPLSYNYPVNTSTQRPYIIQKCYFCGRGVKIRTADPLLLERLPNGRSYNFCKVHWNKLRAYATPDTIRSYQRHLSVYASEKVSFNGAVRYVQVTGS